MAELSCSKSSEGGGEEGGEGKRVGGGGDEGTGRYVEEGGLGLEWLRSGDLFDRCG